MRVQPIVPLIFLLTASLTNGEEPLTPMNSLAGIRETFGPTGAPRELEVVTGEGNTTDANGAVRFAGTSLVAEGNHYFGVMTPLPRPVDIRNLQLRFDARTDQPGVTEAFYVRCYNQGQSEPAWSFHSWDGQLRREWRTFSLQQGLSLSGLSWEPSVVEDRVADRIDRVEFIIGTGRDEVQVDAIVDNLRTAPKLGALADLTAPKQFVRETDLVKEGRACSVVLHPDSDAGRQAAAMVAQAVKDRTGVALPARVATIADRQIEETAILLGNIDTNPALLLLYARYLTPVDSVCPGTEGALVHTVVDPFGKGVNAIVLGASDSVGLEIAAKTFCRQIAEAAKGESLVLPPMFVRHYGKDFLDRFGWADDEPSPTRLEDGLKQGQRALDRGQHTSVAGVLRTVAQRRQLTGHSVEAKLFCALWDLYAASAVSDPRKFGGPWGFDSDFPSAEVVTGWDSIEHDAALSDADRLRTTKAMARWLAEAVIPSCAGAARSSHVPHNHQTFPGLGALFAGLYFSQHYNVAEGRNWLEIADAMFKRQAGYFKPYEDCNGYQWLTNGHLFRYSLARPHLTVFENGNGRRIIDYCIGTMDNLGYQVPYGDTGSWQCWNSEMICLDMFAFAVGDREARWAANLKREIKNTRELHSFYQRAAGERPDRFDGVKVWPLEPQYYETFPADSRPALTECFDKVSFREAMKPDAAYLLLDGLSNGGHRHFDGNSLPRLTQYERIWLADNDYYKSPVKHHNSMLVFKDGQSAAIPPYVELVGAGESDRYGYSRTRLSDYAGVDWDRAVVWLKPLHAFVVLDRLTAREDNEYQFRVLWHGVGEAKLVEEGMFLEQQGPSMWIQLGPGPKLNLTNDAELGSNWSGYPYADPVVRSLSATATVKLAPGESYLYVTALHGSPDDAAKQWRIQYCAGADAALLTTPQGKLAIGLGPFGGPALKWPFTTDAQVVLADSAGLTLLGATWAGIEDRELHRSPTPQAVDIPEPNVLAALEDVEVRPPTVNLTISDDAPAHEVLWEKRPAGDAAVRFTRLASGRLTSQGDLPDVLAATAGGELFALAANASPLWKKEFSCQLNDVAAADLDGDGKHEVVVARQDHYVTVLNDDGEELWSRELQYYRRPPYVNVVRTGDINGDGRPEVIAGGENWRFYAFNAEGTELWNYESVHPSRSGAVADLDGDGKAEVMCGTHYYWSSTLGADGRERWRYSLGPICHDIAVGSFDGDRTRGVVYAGGDGCVHYVGYDGSPRLKYNTGDDVQTVVTGDLDADGRDEILAGSLSHNVYCFGADAKGRWRRDLGAPVTELAIVAVGDQRTLVVAGTSTGLVATLDGQGNLLASSQLGAEIVDLIPHGEEVVVATADGRLSRLRAKR